VRRRRSGATTALRCDSSATAPRRRSGATSTQRRHDGALARRRRGDGAAGRQRRDDGAAGRQRRDDGATTAQRGDDGATARRRDPDQDKGGMSWACEEKAALGAWVWARQPERNPWRSQVTNTPETGLEGVPGQKPAGCQRDPCRSLRRISAPRTGVGTVRAGEQPDCSRSRSGLATWGDGVFCF